MLIAVLSDIHDNVPYLQKALKKIKSLNVSRIIFCGDMCSPFTAKILVDSALPIDSVWGNNDTDHWSIAKQAGQSFTAHPVTQDFGEVVYGGRKIGFCHFPELAKLLVATSHYDAVFHGHTHIAYSKFIGKTLLANPGAISAIIRGRPGLSSFMIYNTKSNQVKLIKVANASKSTKIIRT